MVMTWVAALIVAAPMVALIIYTIEVAIGLLPATRRREPASDMPRCAILMPAHNEAAGIAETLSALATVVPPEVRILVVADNCTDDTAMCARSAGAEVIERHDTERRGKGFALAFGRDALSHDPPEVVIVLDADCQMAPGTADALCADVMRSGRPAQAPYRLTAQADASPMVQISNFAMLVKNCARSRGMARLGDVALLTGTGMAFPWTLFRDAPLAMGDITEDLTLGIVFTRAGVPPRFSRGEVTSRAALANDTHTQRVRWEHGFLDTMRRAPALLGSGLLRGKRSLIFLGLHLLVPPLAMLVALSLASIAAAGALTLFGASHWPATLLGIALLLMLKVTGAAWIVMGRETISIGSIARIPIYILWKLPIYLRFFTGRKESSWVRTRRQNEDQAG